MTFLQEIKSAIYKYFHPLDTLDKYVMPEGWKIVGRNGVKSRKVIADKVSIRIKFDVECVKSVPEERLERLVLKTLESMVGLKWGYGGESCLEEEQEEEEVVLTIARVDVLSDEE